MRNGDANALQRNGQMFTRDWNSSNKTHGACWVQNIGLLFPPHHGYPAMTDKTKTIQGLCLKLNIS